MTINELLSLMKVVRERISNLRELRSEVSTKDTWMREKEKVVEPQYDVKLVDKKLVELETFLFKADAKIKQSNAVVEITNLEVDVDKLLEPLA